MGGRAPSVRGRRAGHGKDVRGTEGKWLMLPSMHLERSGEKVNTTHDWDGQQQASSKKHSIKPIVDQLI